MCLLTVLCPDGRAIFFKKGSFHNVLGLKSLIQGRTGIPVEKQYIVSDSVLKDETAVDTYTKHVSLIPGAIGILITVKIGTYVVKVNVPFDSVVSELLFHLQSHFSYDIARFSLYGNGKELRKNLPVSTIEKVELFLLPPLKEGEMLIFIRTLTGRNVPIIVTSVMSIDELKDLVYAVDGIPAEQQRFIFAGKQLEDGKRLSYYRVSNGSVVHLVLQLRGGMHHRTSTGEGESSLPEPEIFRRSALFVNHGKETYLLPVETFFSLEQVKVLLQEKLGIPMENMTLHNDAGLELENDRALGYYGIVLGSTLRLSVA